MSELPGARFELRKVADKDWLILDHRYAENDARSTVGYVYEVDAYEVEVVWLREIPVALRYMSPVDALDDVRRFYERRPATAPVRVAAPV